MKKIISLFLALAVFCAVAVLPVSAGAERISGGLDVIAAKMTMYKTGMSSHPLAFTPEEFEEAVGIRKINSITVLTLPSAESGTLYLSATPVMVGQVISRKAISKLSFVPKNAGELSCSFTFGTVSSSQPIALTCSLTLLKTLNFAPTAAIPDEGYFTKATVENTPLYSRLEGKDPEGDLLSFRVTSYPKNGTLRILDSVSGEYVYCPLEGFSGKDSFVYRIIDSCGNKGEKITVVLNVEKPSTDIKYCDLDGSKAELAAIKLAERKIIIGKAIGGNYYFDPNGEMSRAEFLALAMNTAGISADYSKDGKTSFVDDTAIPEYLRSYVQKAEKEKWIDGIETPVGLMMMPDKAVTLSEASLMLTKIMNITPDDAVAASASELPYLSEVEAKAVLALASEGIIPTDVISAAQSSMTRADAAILLYNVILSGKNEK